MCSIYQTAVWQRVFATRKPSNSCVNIETGASRSSSPPIMPVVAASGSRALGKEGPECIQGRARSNVEVSIFLLVR